MCPRHIEQREDSLLLAVHLLDVELEFLALKDVTIETATLSGAGCDASEQVVLVELVHNLLLELVALAVLKLSLDVGRLLPGGTCLLSFFKLLLVELDVVVLQVPLTERTGINTDNAVLNEGLGTDKLIVGRVVNNIENTSLARDGLRSPRKSTVINTESTVLVVGTTALHESDLLGTQFSHGGLAAHLKKTLLLVNGHAATGRSSLVSGVPRNTHAS